MASLDQLVERHRKATSGTRWRTTAGPFYMYHWLYRLGFHWVEEWTKLRDYGSQGADWGDPVRKQLRWTVIPLTPWIAGRAVLSSRVSPRGTAHWVNNMGVTLCGKDGPEQTIGLGADSSRRPAPPPTGANDARLMGAGLNTGQSQDTSPASRPLCPDCQGRGATDTETGIPCTRPSASCEECLTCGGTGSAPDPASDPLHRA